MALLRPDEQVFDAMLAGWASQQLARNLGFATIENRQRAVRAFAAHAACPPWQWSAQLVDEWCTDLRAVRHLARSTVRNYTEAVRLLCGYLTDPAYDVGSGVREPVRHPSGPGVPRVEYRGPRAAG